MSQKEILQRISEVEVLAVLRAPDSAGALRAVEALMEGGITGVEVTYSTPDADSVIRRLSSEHGDRIVLGAGTVLTAEQARGAADAGASFLVSPGTKENLVEAMTETGLVTMAGALTPTEVMQSIELGVNVVKIFPGSLGGPSYLRSLRGPFPDVPFMPTGGVSVGNVGDWFAAGAFAVGVGGELASSAHIKAGDFSGMRDRAEELLKALQQSRAASTEVR